MVVADVAQCHFLQCGATHFYAMHSTCDTGAAFYRNSLQGAKPASRCLIGAVTNHPIAPATCSAASCPIVHANASLVEPATYTLIVPATRGISARVPKTATPRRNTKPRYWDQATIK